MIIFYEKKTGQITGTIDGRVHTDDHLKMWMGDKEKTGRLVVNWIQVDGTNDYTPDCNEEMKKVMVALDADPSSVFKYKVDTKTLTLVIK